MKNMGLWLCVPLTMIACKTRDFRDTDIDKFHGNNLRASHFGLSGGQVVLTLDDGPAAHTLKLAKYLKKEGVPTTFFVVASSLNARKSEISQICRMGLHIVASHGGNHRTYRDRSWAELEKVHKPIFEACPNQDYLFYRSPGGAWSGASEADRLNNQNYGGERMMNKYIGPVYWTSEGDHKFSNAQQVYNHYDSSISCNQPNLILMHDIHDKTVRALVGAFTDAQWASFKSNPETFNGNGLVKKLKQKGCRFVALDHNQNSVRTLLGRTPTFVSTGGGNSDGDGSPPGGNIAIKGSGRAKVSTMLKWEYKDSSQLPDGQKCALPQGKAVGFLEVQDATGNHVKIKINKYATSQGCPDSFWQTDYLYLYKPDFDLAPECAIAHNDPNGANVRSSPNGTIVGKLHGGNLIKSLKKEGDWYRFSDFKANASANWTAFSNGAEVFIHKSTLESGCQTFPF